LRKAVKRWGWRLIFESIDDPTEHQKVGFSFSTVKMKVKSRQKGSIRSVDILKTFGEYQK